MLYFAFFYIRSVQISIFVFCQAEIRARRAKIGQKLTKTGDPSFWGCSGVSRSTIGVPHQYFLHLGSMTHLQSGSVDCNKHCNKFYYRKLLHSLEQSLHRMVSDIWPCFPENMLVWPRGAKRWWFGNISDSLMPISQCNKFVINLLQIYYTFITSNRSLQSWFCWSDYLQNKSKHHWGTFCASRMAFGEIGILILADSARRTGPHPLKGFVHSK